ncbi:MAG TPA: hypothetical protein VLK89_07220 [Solirubrobacterales bacterium]|nr:hypothetical protein [Solirubrobacterales bacterium]
MSDAKGSSAPAVRRLAIPAGVFVALLALMVFAIPAGAAKIHQFTSSFGAAGSGPGQFSENKGIAIDQSDGSVYVVDSANFRVQKFDAAGSFVLTFGKGVDQTNPGDVCTAASTDTCGAGTQGSGGGGFNTNGGFSNPTFVAVDPVNGDVYVADSGTNVVDKFTSAGVFLSSNDGSGSGGSFGSLAGIAVDASRNLWAYDESAQMREFDSSGAFLTQWNSGYGVNNFGIAVDSSTNLYVFRGNPKVQRFSSTGTDLGEVDSSGTATSLAVDPVTDGLYVGAGTQVNLFAGGCAPPCSSVESFGAGDIASAAGIAVRGSTETVYVSDPGKSAVEVFNFADVPGATTEAADAVTGTAATLHGTVNPEGHQLTDCHFDFVPASQFEADQYQSVTSSEQVPCVPASASIPADSSDHAVSADISGLALATTYHFRLVATTEGTVRGSDRTFTTLGPTISAQSTKTVGFSGATVSAKINPGGAPTTYHVEYGTATSYGHSSPESAPVGFEGDDSDHTVSVQIDGLASGTAYHFRFIATNSSGSAEGIDSTFATYPTQVPFGSCPDDQFRDGPSARLPDCRAYEQVTPIDKHGADAQGTAVMTQASSAGDRVSFFSNGGLPTTGGSSGLAPFMASRGAAGWSFDGLLQQTDLGYKGHVVGWSEELDPTILTGPGPGNTETALYLRDSDTAALRPGPEGLQGLEDVSIAAFAADTSHLIFESRASLLPGAPAGGTKLYDLDHDTLTLVGRIPTSPARRCNDADGPPCVAVASGTVAGAYNWNEVSCVGAGGATCSQYTQAQNAISRDGSKVFFTDVSTNQVYVRENAIATAHVSASQATPPDPNGEKPAAFMAATPDGSKVFFTSCEKLTDDSTAVSTGEASCTAVNFFESFQYQGQDLYSYDVGSGELTDLTVDSNTDDSKGAAVLGVLGTSGDGSYVYFAANGVLAPGASPGNCTIYGESNEVCNIYVWHNGLTTFVARVAGRDTLDWAPGYNQNLGGKTARVTPDGHALLFSGRQRLTGYDNDNPVCEGGKCSELYHYSTLTKELSCASCNPTGTPPNSDAVLGTDNRIAAIDTVNFAFLSRNLSADGNRVFFESTDALLAADTNGVRDVYEWEAEGSGSCSTMGGCVYLLSSGTSQDPSFFADASANGDHVFLFTSQQLVPSDRDQLVDVYDAGVGAGLPSQHELAPPTCASTACQVNPAPPPEQTAASAVFSGPGNLHRRPAPRKCPKSKRKIRRADKILCQKRNKQRKQHTNRGGSK